MGFTMVSSLINRWRMLVSQRPIGPAVLDPRQVAGVTARYRSVISLTQQQDTGLSGRRWVGLFQYAP